MRTGSAGTGRCSDTLKDEIDYISLHTYIGNPDSNFEKYLSDLAGPG